MIDTNKYENITPERWTVDEEDPCRVVDAQDCTIARTDFVSIDEEREWQLANAQLIADAPLILEDYERLRKRNEWLEEVVALAQEHDALDLSDYGWPQWEEEE